LCWCKDGDAGLGGTSCWQCPHGAVCQNGSLMETARGYWCDQARYFAGLEPTECTLCAARVCCSRATSCELRRQCSANRVGVLCGECPRHHSMALGAVNCVPESDCHGASWIVPLLVLGCGLFAGFRTLRFRPVSSSRGLIDQLKTSRASLVLFYQIAPLVSVGLQLDNGFGSAVDVLFGVFNLQVTEDRREDGGVCFAPGITAVTKTALNVLAPLLLLGWTFVWGFVAFSRHRLRRSSGQLVQYRWQQGFIQGLLSSFTMGYSTLLKVVLSLLQCVPVGALGMRLLINGEIACYTGWQQGLFVVLVGLAMFPAVLWFWLHKQLSSPHFEGSKTEELTAPFAPNRHMWPAVLFIERFVLVLIGSFSPEERRPWILCFVLMLLLGVHIVASPYREISLNLINTALHVLLLAVCMLSTASTMYRVEQVADAGAKLEPFAIAGTVLLFLPFPTLLFIVSCCHFLQGRGQVVSDELCQPQLSHDTVLLDFAIPVSTCDATLFEPNLNEDLLHTLGVSQASDLCLC